jgi:hypothetical protein
VKPAAASAPSSDNDIPDIETTGQAGKGSRSAAGANDGATRGASAGSKTGADQDASQSAPKSGAGATQGASRGVAGSDAATNPNTRANAETLTIPEAKPATLEDNDTSTPAVMEAATPLAPLLGFWKQVDSAARTPDFAPGGHDMGLLAIRPTQRSMQVYRAWGTPPLLVVAAELRATFDPSGTVRIEESPSQPSRFFTQPIDLPARDGAAALRALPAATPLPCEARWKIEADGTLRLDGKLYQRIQREAFQQATQPKANAPATATATRTTPASGAAPASAEPTGGVDFFGARVKGRYICFVCDISGSMMGDKLEALKREIIRTVRALPTGTHYQVVFFNHQALLLQKGWTKTGTKESDALLAKVDGVGCGGGTDPVGALQYAFADLDPIPHELFLLTDGQFGADPMPLLLQVNGGPDRTRIHTLAMGDDADTTQLEAIAKRFGGTFTKVSAAGPGMPAAPPRP